MSQQNLDTAIALLIDAGVTNRPVALTPVECNALRMSADKVAGVLIAEYDTARRRDERGMAESASDVLERIIIQLSREKYGLVRLDLQGRVVTEVAE